MFLVTNLSCVIVDHAQRKQSAVRKLTERLQKAQCSVAFMWRKMQPALPGMIGAKTFQSMKRVKAGVMLAGEVS